MPELGPTLLALARRAIAGALGLPSGQPAVTPAVDQPELQETGATFVTLTRHGQLRGCIGTLEAWRALRDDVQDNARAAAFRDPRFAPLTAAEYPEIHVEVSLLTPPEPLPCASEAEALARLRPEVDGVIFSAGSRRATFLPQVWEQLPDPADFMAHLKRKAGLPADYWGPEVRLQRYQVRKWKENAC